MVVNAQVDIAPFELNYIEIMITLMLTQTVCQMPVHKKCAENAPRTCEPSDVKSVAIPKR